MANANLIPEARNCKRPLNKWPRSEILREIERVDAAIRTLELPPHTEPDLSFLGWQPLGQISRIVSLNSLRRYRRRLGRA